MRYSIEPRDICKIYVKGYGFLSFAKNMGKSLSNKYSQKLLDSAKKSTADAIKTTSKRAIQKTAEAKSDLICNKIADNIDDLIGDKIANNKCLKKKPTKELPNNETKEADAEIAIPKKMYIFPEERT